MKSLLILPFLALPAFAQSELRNFERSGPYTSQWGSPTNGGNTQVGRASPTFDDAGLGRIQFGCKADSKGVCSVRFQDVGDTKNFAAFYLNGKKIEIPEPRENANILEATIQFTSAGWHRVTARTFLKSGLPSTRQDGFSVCK